MTKKELFDKWDKVLFHHDKKANEAFEALLYTECVKWNHSREIIVAFLKDIEKLKEKTRSEGNSS